MRPGLLLLLLIAFSQFSVARANDKTPYGQLHDKWKADREALKLDSDPADPQAQKDRLAELRKVYTHRFLDLARRHPEDDLWLDCLIWIGVQGVPGPDLDAMVDFMRKHANQVDNTVQLTLFMSELIPLESSRLNPALMAIAETHPDIAVQGAASYALSARTKMLAQRNGSPEGCRTAEKLLLKVIADYPEVHTYRGKNKANAERLLQELRGPVAIGKSAPETTGKTLSGEPFDLADHRGKVVVLSFSGHWCGPCVRMHSIEKALFEKYTRKQLEIIEINSDKLDSLESVAEKNSKEGLHWQVVVDGSDGPLAKKWHVNAWPTFYVLDRKHRICRRDVGYIGGKLTEWVDQLIERVPDK